MNQRLNKSQIKIIQIKIKCYKKIKLNKQMRILDLKKIILIIINVIFQKR